MPPALRIALVAAILLAAPGVSARQTASKSPENATYALDATLDTTNRLITGTGRVTWRNISNVAATELRFHMYWNAWRDPSSTWLREQLLADPKTTLLKRPAGDTGFIDLTRLRLVNAAGDEDLFPGAHYIAPDDGNAEDRTVLSVPLAHPIGPGETITIDLAWNAHVPRTYARTGAIGSYFFIAQWFPKLGVLEDGGWNCHQFHFSTEFFSDFGSYDVRLTLPSGWTVGGTGREQGIIDNGNGTRTHHYREEDVHDFAWTSSPDFVDLHQPFSQPGLPSVDVRLLLQPEHRDQADRMFAATRAALAAFGTWVGPYPYGHITVVDPVTIVNEAAQGGGTSGMEYPTLFTAGTRYFNPWRSPAPEDVVVHEAGHQFLQGIVATNEFEHAWMDEGLNTYVTARAMDEAYPNRFVVTERYFGGLIPWTYVDLPRSRVLDGDRWLVFHKDPGWDVESTAAWRYWPGTSRSITYAKTALWMHTLERMVGKDTVQKILTAYFAKGAFKHPTPDEFFATASEVSGRDLTWFFDAVYRNAATFDYAVAQVTAQPLETGSIRTTVVVRRMAPGVFPIDVRVTFGDGSSVVEHWDGADPWKAFTYRRGAEVTAVDVDPERVLLLDLNSTNNSWRLHPRAAEAADKWAIRWLMWAQHLFLTYAFFS